MKLQQSLRVRLTIGFLAVALPLLIMLTYSNYYAMGVVRQQVAESNKSLLSMLADQIDGIIHEAQSYINKLAYQNSDLTSMNYSMNDNDRGEYTLAKTRIKNSLDVDVANFAAVDSFFVYAEVYQELINNEWFGMDYQSRYESGIELTRLIKDEVNEQTRNWKIVKVQDKYKLLLVVKSYYDLYVGALLNIDNIVNTIQQNKLASGGHIMMLSDRSELLTKELAFQPYVEDLPAEIFHSDKPYEVIQAPDKTMVVATSLELADIRLVYLAPERNLLQQLPTFQRFIYVIPLGVLIILILHLLYHQRIVLRPIHQLLLGMKHIRDGNLHVRLATDQSKEFTSISRVFNDMASEIESLKIHAYEQEIKAHQAEIKRLQIQIHPHFLLNSLNVVYNLAELKDLTLIQMMVIHLMKYLRFVTRSNIAMVKLIEEVNHIEHYLQIQQLRFPDHLTYEIDMDEQSKAAMIPPLIFQPFVENSIIHGLVIGERAYHIEIRVYLVKERDMQYVIIHTCDNGAGIPEELLEEINDRNRHVNDNAHLGIHNVRQRLLIHYGKDATLSFGNRVNGGAEVVLRIPYRPDI